MCPHAQQGIICKHVMKVFKVLHPYVPNGAIVEDVGTYYGMHLPLTNPSR
jgi:hypothetical protein